MFIFGRDLWNEVVPLAILGIAAFFVFMGIAKAWMGLMDGDPDEGM